ncbi:hypothetical protein ACFVTP_13845 [Streptomyces celluloflavus]
MMFSSLRNRAPAFGVAVNEIDHGSGADRTPLGNGSAGTDVRM